MHRLNKIIAKADHIVCYRSDKLELFQTLYDLFVLVAENWNNQNASKGGIFNMFDFGFWFRFL